MEGIMDRIQKLLALAERGGTEHEMDTAMRKIQLLLAKHNLSLADCKEHGKKETVITMMVTGAKQVRWQQDIWFAVSRLYFCNCFHFTKRRGDKRFIGQTYMIVGKPSNLEVVKKVVENVIKVGENLSELHGKRQNLCKKSFRAGFGTRVEQRVFEEMAKATETQIVNECRAVALANVYDQAKRENDEYLNKQDVKTTKMKQSLPEYESQSFQHGYINGGKVSLSGTEHIE